MQYHSFFRNLQAEVALLLKKSSKMMRQTRIGIMWMFLWQKMTFTHRGKKFIPVVNWEPTCIRWILESPEQRNMINTKSVVWPNLAYMATKGDVLGNKFFWDVRDNFKMPKLSNNVSFSLVIVQALVWARQPLNPLHPNISKHFLHTVLNTFPKVPTRRICWTIKSLFSWWSFPLFSWPQRLF